MKSHQSLCVLCVGGRNCLCMLRPHHTSQPCTLPSSDLVSSTVFSVHHLSDSSLSPGNHSWELGRFRGLLKPDTEVAAPSAGIGRARGWDGGVGAGAALPGTPCQEGRGAGRARGGEGGSWRACERKSCGERERARCHRPPPERSCSEAVRSAAFQRIGHCSSLH